MTVSSTLCGCQFSENNKYLTSWRRFQERSPKADKVSSHSCFSGSDPPLCSEKIEDKAHFQSEIQLLNVPNIEDNHSKRRMLNFLNFRRKIRRPRSPNSIQVLNLRTPTLNIIRESSSIQSALMALAGTVQITNNGVVLIQDPRRQVISSSRARNLYKSHRHPTWLPSTGIAPTPSRGHPQWFAGNQLLS